MRATSGFALGDPYTGCDIRRPTEWQHLFRHVDADRVAVVRQNDGHRPLVGHVERHKLPGAIGPLHFQAVARSHWTIVEVSAKTARIVRASVPQKLSLDRVLRK